MRSEYLASIDIKTRNASITTASPHSELLIDLCIRFVSLSSLDPRRILALALIPHIYTEN